MSRESFSCFPCAECKCQLPAPAASRNRELGFGAIIEYLYERTRMYFMYNVVTEIFVYFANIG
jgi:hypothetical protein